MSSCNGNGECLIECYCKCYNEETEEYYELCVCGHREHSGNREHNRYCPSVCCKPIECRNYKYCNVKQPKWLSFCHNGMCMNCAILMGKHTYTTQLEDCCVCLENKNMLILKCNHKICNDCWYNISIFGSSLCPLCRNINAWGK